MPGTTWKRGLAVPHQDLCGAKTSGELVLNAVLTCVRTARQNEMLPVTQTQPFLLGDRRRRTGHGHRVLRPVGALERTAHEPRTPHPGPAAEGWGPRPAARGPSEPRTWEAGCCLRKAPGEAAGSGTKFRETLEANKTEQNRPEGTAKKLLFLHLSRHRTI